jgi:hypothetical protein
LRNALDDGSRFCGLINRKWKSSWRVYRLGRGHRRHGGTRGTRRKRLGRQFRRLTG